MMVEKEIGRHAADGMGMVDYAVASSGGRSLMILGMSFLPSDYGPEIGLVRIREVD